ncbi:HPC2 [Candida margitis]|uniref:HPC2 n=1 Tax=Candida margitis TaxID=1775924 RepID=UPI002227D629|nr:HPC2 [Candida margitis]KAI5969611.1 HPC2 [Candida margitis]
MSQGASTNVSISSLLDSNSSSTNTAAPDLKSTQSKSNNNDKRPVYTPIQKLVSQYQTSFDPVGKSPNDTGVSDKPFLHSKQLNNTLPSNRGSTILGKNGSKSRSLSGSPPVSISDQVKKFQTKFQLGPVATPQPKSKTSINSIINLDDEVITEPLTPSQSADILKSHNLVKRKKANTTGKANDSKKHKSNTPDLQNSPAIVSKQNVLQARASKENNGANTSKNEPIKKLSRPDLNVVKAPTKPVKLSAPTVIDLLNPDDEEDIAPAPSSTSSPVVADNNDKTKEKAAEKTTKEKEKEREKVEPPIVALNIPLLDPKDPQPGKAEVVVNVLKLAEDKYGWSVMHPKAKSAIEVMDDMMDDEEDDDDDDDLVDDQEKAPHQQQQQQQTNSILPVAPRGKELTEEQLVRQHEIKMIRKVGKYDFEDPFIDDVELQMEEDISSTKEGFFVYWGPLVDDRSSGKKSSKKK